MTRLERSVFMELLQSFGVALGAMTVVTVVGAVYEPIRDGLPFGAMLKFVPLFIPQMLPWTVPTAFVAACIMTYSRMAGNNELTAVRAAGVHIWRVLTPAAVMAVGLCVVCSLLNHEGVPLISYYQYSIVKSAAASEVAQLIKTSDPVMRIGPVTVYMGEVNEDNSFEDIVLVMPEKVMNPGGARETGENQTQITYLRAPGGHFEVSGERGEIVFYLDSDPGRNTGKDRDAGSVVLLRSVQGRGSPRDFERAVMDSAVVPVKLRSLEDLKMIPTRGKHLTTQQLMLKVRLKETSAAVATKPDTKGKNPSQAALALKKWKRERLEVYQWETSIHMRSSLSLAPLLLGLIAVPIGVMTRHGRRLVAYGLAIGLVLGVYYPLMAAAPALGDSNLVAPAAAMWGVTALIAAMGLVLVRTMLRR